MNCLKLLGLGFLICATALADDRMRDGNWWKAQPNAVRVWYVLGILDGLRAEERAASETSQVDGYVVLRGNATAGQIKDGLDQFYTDFRNRSIATSDAFLVVWSATAGASEDRTRAQTLRYREADAQGH